MMLSENIRLPVHHGTNQFTNTTNVSSHLTYRTIINEPTTIDNSLSRKAVADFENNSLMKA